MGGEVHVEGVMCDEGLVDLQADSQQYDNGSRDVATKVGCSSAHAGNGCNSSKAV